MVTNIPRGFWAASSSFSRSRICFGPSSWRASVRSSVTVTAMNKAAVMPFPHTSPTAMTSRSSDTRRTSKRSPPTCRAGSIVAWTSSPMPRPSEARSEGRSPIWISRAMARSRSWAARIASA